MTQEHGCKKRKRPTDSDNYSDSDSDSDNGEEWDEVLVLNPDRKGIIKKVTTTTLVTRKGNRETTKNVYILLDTGYSNAIISNNYQYIYANK